jgi:hypothetical protein
MMTDRHLLHTVVFYALLLVGSLASTGLRAADALAMFNDPLYSQWSDEQASVMTEPACVDSLVDSYVTPGAVFRCAAKARADLLARVLQLKYGPDAVTFAADEATPAEHHEPTDLEFR